MLTMIPNKTNMTMETTQNNFRYSNSFEIKREYVKIVQNKVTSSKKG